MTNTVFEIKKYLWCIRVFRSINTSFCHCSFRFTDAQNPPASLCPNTVFSFSRSFLRSGGTGGAAVVCHGKKGFTQQTVSKICMTSWSKDYKTHFKCGIYSIYPGYCVGCHYIKVNTPKYTCHSCHEMLQQTFSPIFGMDYIFPRGG